MGARMRSKLFVPGARPELFDKALAGDADALSFDLEDAVLAARKDDARQAVAGFLAGEAAGRSDKTMIVRINAPDSPWFAQDIAAVTRGHVALVNLPKIESAAAVRDAVQVIEAAERDNRAGRPVRLLVNIETPRALAAAADIAAAHPRVAGLQLGLGDLFGPLGVERYDAANVHAVMFALRMAAAQAGVFAVDGAFPAIDDADGYRAEAAMARRLGFVGKSCVHPRQVALANEAFAPTETEIAAAQRVVAAAEQAQRESLGAFVVDGAMVDAPYLQRAQALLAAARRGR
jgi:citrate lyase subunit beta / citryl-CoA lyase